MAKSTAVVSPNLGLYLDRSVIALSPRMLQDGSNFRIKEGKLSNLNLGWTRVAPTVTLNGTVLLVDSFFRRGLDETLIFGTKTGLYKYNPVGDDVSFITPIYNPGTAAASGTAVTGIGTLWSANAKAGDEIHFGINNQTDP